MRLGLIRHFPVEEKFPAGWRTAAELVAWRERYDRAAVSVGDYDLGGVAWRACLSSDLPRARMTADTVFCGQVEHTELLREAQFAAFPTGGLRLPVQAWRWLLRLAWMTGHGTQRACREEFMQRVEAVADHLCTLKEDTLVVSHAGMMAYLSAKLRRCGFSGPKLRIAKHARVYLYERNEA